MKCPIDATNLVMSDRHGVEIDYCPTCRGVWLDRGELDKIIDRAASTAPLAGPARQMPAGEAPRPPRHHDDDRYDDRGRPRKRRESFLGELFDF